MLAHNSVDRGSMARDSIELNLDEQTSLPGKPPRVRNSNQRSAISYQREQDEPSQSRAAALREQRRARAKVSNENDSELLINPDDLDMDELDSEEAQFLRTDRRVPVRRGALPKKTVHWLKIGGMVAGAVAVCGVLFMVAGDYAMHAARFRVQSSDSIEISGVRNASAADVMHAAATDVLEKNIFYIDLDQRRHDLERLPWVEQATVMRLLPNRIAVTILERTPVAFAQIGSHISLIDANGVILGMPADRKTKYSFPVIRGIAETEPLSSRAAAMKIYNRLVGELGASETETSAGTNYVRQLSEVDLSDPEDVKVTANDPGGTMVVHLGPAEFLPHYKLYVAHIAEWRQQFPNLQSVDLRYEGQVVVNPDRPNREIGTSGDLHPSKPKSGLPGTPGDRVIGKTAAKVAKPVAKAVAHKAVAHKATTSSKPAPQRKQKVQSTTTAQR